MEYIGERPLSWPHLSPEARIQMGVADANDVNDWVTHHFSGDYQVHVGIHNGVRLGFVQHEFHIIHSLHEDVNALEEPLRAIRDWWLA